MIQACRNFFSVGLVPVNLHWKNWSWWKATGNTEKVGNEIKKTMPKPNWYVVQNA